MKKFLITLFITLIASTYAFAAGDFTLSSAAKAKVFCAKSEAEVVHTALDIFKGDVQKVLNAQIVFTNNAKDADIVIRTEAQDIHEGFTIKVSDNGTKSQLLITGTEPRGTAYGLMKICQMLGVSPWEWWADVVPAQKESFSLPDGCEISEHPSVAYRGIFINDEDWGMMPWASTNYEPKMRGLNGGSTQPIKGEMGPYTHQRIFELLLRLKANYFWPAMHECSKPFYLTKGNNEAARKYGILVSTSHCEPMMCNANGEWNIRGNGDYDFIHNPKNVTAFWEQRVREVKRNDCVYTLGMRGIHDSGMVGAETMEQQVEALQNIIDTQRGLLAKHINKDVTKVPQQFIPYKEVLDCYHAGLKVPDDVTLIWCDDNYGYVRHFPTPEERLRKGGNGIYYHVSYWGRPHDYLWLSTTHPQLIKSEMTRAFDHGIQNVWVLNVGDIKPSEYLISLFLDMAWDIDKVRNEGVEKHLDNWYSNAFGFGKDEWNNLWKNYYDLSFDRRPEFMSASRTEEKDPKWKEVADLDMSREEIEARVLKCRQLMRKVAEMETRINDAQKASWLELVKYPILGMANLNIKTLYAQLARHGLAKWEVAEEAYDNIQALTAEYNTMLDGKWNGMIDAAPRRLSVFDPVKRETFNTELPSENSRAKVLWTSNTPVGSKIAKGDSRTFDVELPSSESLELVIKTLPVHPTIDNGTLRYTIQIDNEKPIECEYHTEGRSEEWKENVLNNTAIRTVKTKIANAGQHSIKISALDDGIMLQKISIR